MKHNGLAYILKGSPDKPLVILAHGLCSSKESTTYQVLEKSFNQKGIATLRFDFFAHGESDGDMMDLTLTKAKENILEMIDFAKQQGFSKIALVGSSFGGNAAILAASLYHDFFALVLKCPVSSHLGKLLAHGQEEVWQENGYIEYVGNRIGYGFYTDAEATNTYEAAQHITNPTIIVHGTADGAVPIEQSKRLKQEIPNATLKIIEGANHRFTDPFNFQIMIDEIEKFIMKNV